MQVSRSAYYDWLQREPTDNEQENAKFCALFSKIRSTYGTRRIKKELLKQGWEISRRRG
jgi:hypothetical protein